MTELLKILDFLSHNVELYLKGSNRIKTKLGGFLCVNLLIIAFIGFVYLSSKILDYSDYTVSMNRINYKYHNYTLNTSETVIAFKLMNMYGFDVDDRTYSAYANYIKFNYIKDENGVERQFPISVPLKVSKCGENFRLNSTEFETIYAKSDMSKFYCLEPGQEILIANPFGSPYNFSLINFLFTHCTHRRDCKNATQIDKELSAYYAIFVSTKYYADNTNYAEPLRPYMSVHSEISSSSFYKKVDFSLKNLVHNSDVGLVLSDKRQVVQPAINDIKTDIDFRAEYTNKGKNLMQISYFYNKEGFLDIYDRNYKRIQNVLAEIGGFISFLRIIVSLLLTFYNQLIFVHLLFKNFNFFNSEEIGNHAASSSVKSNVFYNKDLMLNRNHIKSINLINFLKC